MSGNERVYYASGLINLKMMSVLVGIIASKRLHALDQRRLGVTPSISNIDDERNPAIMEDGLSSNV